MARNTFALALFSVAACGGADLTSEYGDCIAETARTSFDEPTLAGPSAQELVAPWIGRSFEATWSADGPPAPTVYTNLGVESSSLEVHSVRFRDDAECPSIPRVDVVASTATLDPLSRVLVSFRWCDDGAQCISDGAPHVAGGVAASPELEAWVLQRAAAIVPPPPGPLSLKPGSISIVAPSVPGGVWLSASLQDANGDILELNAENCPECKGAWSLLPHP